MSERQWCLLRKPCVNLESVVKEFAVRQHMSATCVVTCLFLLFLLLWQEDVQVIHGTVGWGTIKAPPPSCLDDMLFLESRSTNRQAAAPRPPTSGLTAVTSLADIRLWLITELNWPSAPNNCARFCRHERSSLAASRKKKQPRLLRFVE